MHRSHSAPPTGFTLVELLLVVVIIGVIAAFVLPKFTGVKEEAFVDAMKNDLRNFATYQEIHHDNTGAYAADPAEIADFSFSEDVGPLASAGTASAWELIVDHDRTGVTCALGAGVETSNEAATLRCSNDDLTIALSDANPDAGQQITLDAGDAISQMALLDAGLPGTPLFAADPSEVATLHWNLGDGTVKTGPPATHTVITHSYNAAGEYVITVTITKHNGKKEIARVTIVVGSNTAPAPAFTWNPLSPEEGASVVFTNQSDDVDGHTLSYLWNFGDGGTASVANPTYTFSAAGDYTVTLTATDELGASNTASNLVTVVAGNQAPVASVTVSPASPVDGDDVTFDATGSTDADGSIVYYYWAITGSANIDTHGSSGTFTTAMAEGSYTVQVIAEDNEGARDTASQAFTVGPAPNEAPTVSIDAPAGGTTATEGDTVSFQATATDPEDGALSGTSVEWSSDLDGVLGTGSPLSVSTLSVGSHTITVTATDSEGLTDAATVSVTVEAAAVDPNFSQDFDEQSDGQAPASWTISGDAGGSYIEIDTRSIASGTSPMLKIHTDDADTENVKAIRTLDTPKASGRLSVGYVGTASAYATGNFYLTLCSADCSSNLLIWFKSRPAYRTGDFVYHDGSGYQDIAGYPGGPLEIFWDFEAGGAGITIRYNGMDYAVGNPNGMSQVDAIRVHGHRSYTGDFYFDEFIVDDTAP